MSNLITVDIGEDARKVQQEFEKYYNLTVKNGAKDIADSYAKQAADKAKAEIEAVISMVEATVEEIATKGVNELYSALGLNEETIQFAKTTVNLANKATSLAATAVLKGIIAINNFDAQAIPLSAAAAGLQVLKSIADIFLQKFTELYGVYIDMIINFITDPGQALEMLKEAIDAILQQIEDLIDEQCRKYLGMSLSQLKYYCRKGIGIYKQIKQAKAKAKKDKDETNEVNVSGSGSKKSIKVNANVDTEQLKANMKTWLNEQRDAIYNGFMIMQIKDAVLSIKDTIKAMTDINLLTLADNMNSLDDLVALLDELGLGDDSTAIDLSMIPMLNINDIYASMNNLMSISTLENSLSTLGGAAISAVNVSATTTSTKTYDISTDVNTKIITVEYYTNPTKQSIAKKVNKILNQAKNAEGKELFSLATCKVIQETTNSLYNNGLNKIGETIINTDSGYKVKIVLKIPEEQKKDKNNKNQNKEPIPQPEPIDKESPQINLSVVSETMKSAEKIDEDRANTRRNTIALLHMLFGILKTINPLLQTLATLISNYKTNKAYVAGNSRDSLYSLYKECMNKLGLNKSKQFCAPELIDTDVIIDPSSIMYTVRTYSLYTYIKDTLHIIKSGEITKDIKSHQAVEINNWLDINDKYASKINTDNDMTLFIDIASIQEEVNCIERQKKSMSELLSKEEIDIFVDCKPKHNNGSFEDLENMEIVGNTIIYSDENLPRMGSQIMMAQMRGYKYDE